MKKIINVLVIFLILVFSIYLNKNYFNYEKDKVTINKTSVEEEITIKEKEKTPIPQEYLGYLTIERLNIKNFILDGTENQVLDKNVIGVHKASVDLNSNLGNIILAGHNNKHVFGNLKNIALDDEITLVTKTSCLKFKVINITIYDKNDYSYYKYVDDLKMLTLITCYGNNNYRLVVVATEV